MKELSVAVVGRPNVGKSTLFNRLTGKKQAIVDDTPGVTRDRKIGKGSIADLEFSITDTAGLENAKPGKFEALMMKQTNIAIEGADVLLFVVDARMGVTEVDKYFSRELRTSGKPIILVANKCEGKIPAAALTECYALGFGEPVCISAEHGEGMGDLYDALKLHKREAVEEEEQERYLQLAIVGRPNAGKSTLLNKLLKEERVITSDIPGTTRDSIYVEWEFNGTPIRLVDTAGLRKKSRIDETLEKLMVSDTMNAIRFAHVVVLLVDAARNLEKQDLKIAGHVLKEGRGLVIAVNKWDLVEDKPAYLDELQYEIEKTVHEAKGVAVVTLSALEGKGLNGLIKTALEVYELWNAKISTAKLNSWLEKATDANPPPAVMGKRIRLKYMTQNGIRPPSFLVFANQPSKIPDSYKRHLLNSLRQEFALPGVPIRFAFKKQDNPYAP